MDRLEQKLKRALAREDPPAGLAGRVQARMAAREAAPAAPVSAPRRLDWLFGHGGRMALTGGLAVVIAIAGLAGYRLRQERIQGERAHAELMTALQVTAHQLTKVRHVLTETR